MLPESVNANAPNNRETTPDYSTLAGNPDSGSANEAHPFFLAIHDVLAGHEPEHQLNLQPSDDDALTQRDDASSGLHHLQSTIVNSLTPPPVHPTIHNGATGTAAVADAATQLLAGTLSNAATRTTTPPEPITKPSPPPPPPPPPIGGASEMLPPTESMKLGQPNGDGEMKQIEKRRGLIYAQEVRNKARTEFKIRRKRELEEAGETERVTRRRRNDTTLSKRGKYLRRLQKNQDSAAAARASNDAYIQCLEEQCEKYDPDVEKLSCKLNQVKNQRDIEFNLHNQVVSHNLYLVNTIRNLRQILAPNNPPPSLPDNPEDELGFVRLPNAR